MVESEANELTEEKMLEAVIFGQESYQKVIDAIINLAKKSAKDPWILEEKNEEVKSLPEVIFKEFEKKFQEIYSIIDKQNRTQELELIRNKITEAY